MIGLAPKQNSSGGKEKLGSTSKAGNRYLLQMHVLGQADCGDVDVGVGYKEAAARRGLVCLQV